jgi:signal transduction histidine kinase
VDQASEVRRPFERGEVLREIGMTLGPMFHATPYTLEIDCNAPIPMDSYPGALGQILTNLVTNALIHGLEGRPAGRIQVIARPAAESVSIRVCDDGAGIGESALQRIFDPFFTTRLGKGGSGLGLYIVYNLVTRSLGGQISAASEPGTGTCFTLSLPRTAPSTDAPGDALAIPSRPTPGLNFDDAGPIN